MCNGLCGVGLLNDSDCKSETQRQWLEDVRGLTVRGYGDCCDDGSDVENGVTPIKTRLLRKDQSSGSDTMLIILNDCIVFHNQRSKCKYVTYRLLTYTYILTYLQVNIFKF